MSVLGQLAEVRLPEEDEEERAAPRWQFKPEDFVTVWSKSVGNIVVVLKRLKCTPALYLAVYRTGQPVYLAGPFFTKRSFEVLNIDWESVAAELKRSGEDPLAALPPSEWQKLLEEVKAGIPSSPIMPSVKELGEPIPVTVEDLAKKADNFLWQPVEVEGVIIGRSEIRTIPVAVKVEGKKGEQVIPFNLSQPKLASKLFKIKGDQIDEARFFVVYLQQLMGHDKFTVYVVGCEVPKSKMIRVRGVVVSVEPNPRKLVVLATEVKPLNEVVEHFEVTQELLREAGFRVSSYEELKRVVDSIFAPKIIGRAFAKMALALSLFSVENINYGGEERSGLINVLFYGDTTTGKSSIARWLRDATGWGAFTSAETGSRAGLLYTIDTDTRTVIWGAVTLADREYAVIDGFDKLSPEEWKEFREAITNRQVVVTRVAQAVAPFRVRLVLCANTRETMSEYMYPVEAITSIPPLGGKDAGASFTRIDLYVPFYFEEVPMESIVEAQLREVKVPLEELKKKILLAWKVSVAVFEPGTLPKLKEITLDVARRYGGMKPPIIHNNYLCVVMKVAAAFASLLSKYRLTGRGLEVVVTEDVVPFVAAFFEEYLNVLKVEGYVRKGQADIAVIMEEIERDGKLARALELIYLRTRAGTRVTKTELGEALGIRDRNKQVELVGKLVELGLAVSRPNMGVILTPEGRKAAVALLKKKEQEERKEEGGVSFKSSSSAVFVCCDFTQGPMNSSDSSGETIGSKKEGKDSSGAQADESTRRIEFQGTYPPTSTPSPGHPVSESEEMIQPSEPERGAVSETLNQPFSHGPVSAGRIDLPPNTPLQTAGDEEGAREEPYGFAMCYLRVAQRLKEEPSGLSEEEVIRYAVEQGFSEKLVRAVLQFMRERGKVSEPRQGWLVWSG